MSILKASYKQTGGVLPGQGVQTATDDFLYGPDAAPFDFDPNYDQQLANFGDWLAQPGNLQQYYTGNTVAAPGPALEDAWARYTDAAGERDSITNQLVADYQSQLDPNSALNQQYAQNAANRAGTAFFGAGTPGSSRGQYASQVAAQDVYRDRRDKALAGLGAQRGELEKGADLISRVGKEQRGIGQDVIDSDVHRWDYYQNLPYDVQTQLLGVSAAQTGLSSEAPIATLDLPAIGGGETYDKLYSNQGGIQGDPMMQDPMAGGAVPPLAAPMGQPPMEPPTPAPAGIMGDPMMEGPMMMVEEPQSEIDKIEEKLQAIAMASDGAITIKRKSKKKGSK